MSGQAEREKAFFVYTGALERGDFLTLSEILLTAESDEALEQLLIEQNTLFAEEDEKEKKQDAFFEPATPLTPINPKPTRPQTRSFRLLEGLTRTTILNLGVTLVVAIVFGLIVLWLIVPTTNNPNPVSGTSTTSPDLSYAGATRLEISEQGKALMLSSVSPVAKDAEVGLYVSSDNIKKIADYYKKKFSELGYSLVDYSLTDNDTNFTMLEGDKTTSVFVAGTKVTADSLKSMVTQIGFENLAKQIEPGQTLLLVINFKGSPNTLMGLPPTIQAPTPVPASSVAYLGPDNNFHPDNGSGLVLTVPSSEVSGIVQYMEHTNNSATPVFSEGVATARVDWLVSDQQKLYLQIRLGGLEKGVNLDAITISGQFGKLIDDRGQVYPLTLVDGPTSESAKTLLLTGQSTPLNAGVHSLTLNLDDSKIFKLNGPLSFEVKSFKNAALPEGMAQAVVPANVNGLKLGIGYAYFGIDRTVLQIFLDQSGYFGKEKTESPGKLQLNESSFTVKDDKGRLLGAKPGPTNAATLPGFNQYWLKNTGTLVLELEPVKQDTKNLVVAVNELEFNVRDALKSFRIPVTDLLKQGVPVDLNQSLEIGGIKLQITTAAATLNSTTQKVNLRIKYLVQEKGVAGLRVKDVFWICDCSYEATNLPFTKSLSFSYNSEETNYLQINPQITFVQAGPWQITFPVSHG